ncbi:MAG: hypothetical protein M1442_03115 [Candidatus Thermoplasmatota archaeon]|jgi:hypothetical protein|nr:hypothetical protein [Candidatus Thermoplasmatota archaeon]
MSSKPPPGLLHTNRRLPSLTLVTIRRGALAGRFYLAVGVVVSLILTIALLRTARGNAEFVTIFPLEIPLFASLGAMGGLMLFVGDRSKGVLEYFISYGVRPRALFVNSLLVTITLTTIVLGSSLAVGLVGYSVAGNTLSADLENSILGYTIPMAYASALFASIGGIIWSALSTPRMGMNTPVGLAPLLGVAPPILVLIVAEGVDKAAYYYVTLGSALGFFALVVILLVASSRLMDRERYLSPM